MTAVDEIKARIDIVDFISRYVPLKRAGTTYKGLCPFHSERTPSFIVFGNSGTWKCFGACGIGGDVLTFLMRKENLEFREALQLLAREAGVNLEEEEKDEEAQQRNQLYEINRVATGYFQELLAHHPAAHAARAYLDKRGIDAATREGFQLGFALDGWNGLRDFLSARGFSLDLQQNAGLVKRHAEKESIYDAFRARVMIPIRDRQSRVIGFGGRVLDDTQPKYLNTPETALFHKSHIVYGIDLAHQAIRAANQVVIVEGYMDVIAAHQHGFANVVACMGTALTAEQLRQLQRYTNHFILALDADSAGQAATIRGLNQARQSLARVQKPTVMSSGQVQMTERLGAILAILSMPTGLDPDDVIRNNPEAWKALIAAAKPLVDFSFDIIRQQVDLQSAAGKGQAVAQLAPLIAELEDEIERQHYIQRLSRLVQMDEMLIANRILATLRTLRAAPVSTRKNRQEGEIAAEHPLPVGQVDLIQRNKKGAPLAPKPVSAILFDQEDHLIANLLRDPQLLMWLSGAVVLLELTALQPEDMDRVENQELLRALRHYLNGNEPWDLELFQETLPKELHGHLAQLIVYGLKLPPSDTATIQNDAVKTLIRIRLQKLKTENNEMKYLLDDAQQSQDRDAIQQFSQSNNLIRRQLFHLQQLNVNLNKMMKPGFGTQL